jgi:hypothetical protein
MNNSAEPQKAKIIIDTNRHGIRREMYAAGYKTIKKRSKKNKKKDVSHETR